MPENVNYKKFNEEEDLIYKKGIDAIRSNVNNGIRFDLACEAIAVEDNELRALIIDDALKIEIAELHYGKGLSLLDVSKRLGVSMDRLLKANTEMMEDIVNTAEEVAKKQPPSSKHTTH